MNWQFNPYIILLCISMSISTAIALYSFYRRLTPGSKAFSILMLAVAAWSIEYAMELGSIDLSGKLFWIRLQYISIVIIPVAWIVFILEYTISSFKIKSYRIMLLSMIPGLTLLLVYTNEYHGLIMSNIGLDTSGSFPVLIRTFGAGFWFFVSYCYILLFIGSCLLVRAIVRNPDFYMGQSIALLIGAVTPWMGNAIYVFGLSPIPAELDPTVFLFTLSGIALTWAIFRGRLLDIVPIVYDTVIRSMDDGVLILDKKNRVLDVNPAAEHAIGKSRVEAIGQHVISVLEDWPELLDICIHPPDKNQEILFEEGDIRRYMDIKVSPLYGKGKVTGRVIVLHDITENRLAGEILSYSEERYRSLVENTMDGYAVYEIPSGRFLFLNQRACDFIGYTMEEGMKLNVRDIRNKKDIPGLERMIEKALAGQMMPSRRQVFEVLRKNGTTFLAEVTSSLVTFQGKRAIQGVIRDITEQNQLQKQLQRAQKMEALGTLAGGVAHDLNNLFAGLVSYPELLLIDLEEDSPLRKPILTIKKTGEKATAIVQDLLTLARRGVAVTKILNLNDIISEYLKSPEYERLKYYHQGVSLITDFAPNLLNIKGSPVHLSKTIMNLTSNAAEAILGEGKIQISTQNIYIDRPVRGYDHVKEGDYVLLMVSDSGLGISPEDKERIFEPFYTKKIMGRSGTGLGMAVVWGTVKDHNGYIDIHSVEGVGTTLKLYFPTTREQISRKESAMTVDGLMGNGETVLVIDDVEEQRAVASGMLGKLGYSVTSVSSGEEAIEYLKENSADLLVLDMIMDPGIDGLDTYKRILELHPGQKAIIASGFSETDRVKEAQDLGAGAYVKKPYLLEDIGLAVKEELAKK